MAIRITNSGRRARDDTVNDLTNAINEMELAIEKLNKCPGLGAPLYTARVEKLINRYEDLKKKIRRIG